ncbi:MAG: AAA family ATPase [Gammaproteobacteria bacterium]
MKTLAFFNNKGGVGTTSLVYHLAWMYADLGVSVLAVDLDPQADLTSRFVEDERLEELWAEHPRRQTVFGAIQPLLEGAGDISSPHVEHVADGIGLLAGDLALSVVEDELTAEWHDRPDRKVRGLRGVSALGKVIELAARQREATLALIDVGPNLGAISRAALLAAEHVTIPLAPDLYSLQGLRNLGPVWRRWRSEWTELRAQNPARELSVLSGEMQSAGYVVMQRAQRLDRAVKPYRWMAQIPSAYREATSDPPASTIPRSIADDPECLAVLMHYRSLIPLAQDARKPMFFLKPADGATGGHIPAVQSCYREFRELAQRLAARCRIAI